MKRIILLLVFIFLLAGLAESVSATISPAYRIYTSNDFGASWKSTQGFSTYLYLDGNGDLYYITPVGSLYYDIKKSPYGGGYTQDFGRFVANNFIPKGIGRVNSKLFIWGQANPGVGGSSIYYYDGTKWVAAGLKSKSTYWLGYWNNRYWAQTNDNVVWLYSFFGTDGSWFKSSISALSTSTINNMKQSYDGIYDRGYLGTSLNVIIRKNSNKIVGGLSYGDFEVFNSTYNLWVIDRGKLYHYNHTEWGKQHLTDTNTFQQIEINEKQNKLVLVYGHPIYPKDYYMNIYDPSMSYMVGLNPAYSIFEVEGQSGNNQILDFEVNGNNIAIAVKWICKDNDKDQFSGEDIIVNGEIICKKEDCDDTNPNIHPGVIENCDGIDNNCINGIDENCGCTPLGKIETCGTDLNNDGILNSTDQVGECKLGNRTCASGGIWGTCIESVAPLAEICNDEKDNDCDSLTDCADSDCSSASNCIPTPPVIPTPATCEEAENSQDCHTISSCYWDEGFLGDECKEITASTTCDDLSVDLGVCESSGLNCEIKDGECMEKEISNLGCSSGYPMANGDCGNNADSNGVCEYDDSLCSYGELCGACDDCIGYGEGGCAINSYCYPDKGCITEAIDPEIKCEDVGFLESECTAMGELCLNEYYLTCDTPPCLSEGAFDVNGEMCCLGKCFSGQVEFTATGTVNTYSYGPCRPLETGSSEGERKVYINSLEQRDMSPCTIIPSRRIPFSSALGVLVGLIIIILFYILRKKH